jgi:hypothetical protein
MCNNTGEKMAEKKQRNLEPWIDSLLIYKGLHVKGKGKQLIIPFELTKKQSRRISKYFDFDTLDEEDFFVNFDRILNEICHKSIKQKVKLATKYYERHPDEWVRMVKPIKVTDQEIEYKIAKYKDNKLRKFKVFHFRTRI